MTEITSIINQTFLLNFGFFGRLLISKSKCHEKHQLAYKCSLLKNTRKTNSTRLWNNSVNVKLNKSSQSVKIHHIVDIGKLLGVDNLEELPVNKLIFDV